MSIISAALIKCNSSFKSEDDFLYSGLLSGISFAGNKVIDVIIDPEPMYKETPTKKEYFESLDLSKGVNHYSISFCFSTLKEAKAASESGSVFKLCEGVVIQFMSCDAEEHKNHKDLEVLENINLNKGF